MVVLCLLLSMPGNPVLTAFIHSCQSLYTHTREPAVLSFQPLHCHMLVKSFGPAAWCFHSFVLDFPFYTHMEVCFALFAVPALQHTTEMLWTCHLLFSFICFGYHLCTASLSPDFRIIYRNKERLFLSGFPAMLALGEIRLQILQLRMPLMATSWLSSSHSQT